MSEPSHPRDLVLQAISKSVTECRRILEEVSAMLEASMQADELLRPLGMPGGLCLHPDQFRKYGSCNDIGCTACFTAAGKPRRRR